MIIVAAEKNKKSFLIILKFLFVPFSLYILQTEKWKVVTVM